MRKYKILYLFVFIFILSGCGSGPSSSSSVSQEEMYAVDTLEEYNGIDNDYESPSAEDVSKQNTDDVPSDENSQLEDEPEKDEKKKIIIGEIRLEVENLNDTKDNIESITEFSGGYIESINSSRYGTKSNFNAVLRIPTEKYKEVKKQIQELGYVVNLSESEEDITRNYYSTKAELELKEQEAKMLEELLLQAGNIEEILMMERRLSEVRGDINTNRYILQNMDLVTSYSTININVKEVNYDVKINSELTGFGKKFNNAIKRSISNTIIFFQGILLLFAAYGIQMIFVLIIIFIIYKIVKRFGNSKGNIKKAKRKVKNN